MKEKKGRNTWRGRRNREESGENREKAMSNNESTIVKDVRCVNVFK